MDRYYYQKDTPRIKNYRPNNSLVKNVRILDLHQKLGILLFTFGITILAALIFSETAIIAKTDTIVSAVPLEEVTKEIVERNANIDKLTPINNYIKEAVTQNDTKFNGLFYISFPSLRISNIRIQGNVESGSVAEYEKILNNNAAHFKGTPLPGEGGNTFVYAHSSPLWYHALYPDSYQGIFTSLFNLKIGEKVIVKFKEKTYTYLIEGITTIDPTDFSQVKNITGVNTLTLMTCSPPGLGDKRLIVKAIQL